MRAIIIISILFISIFTYSQDFSMLSMTVFDSHSNKPVIYKKTILYSDTTVLGDSFIGDNGSFTFYFDTINFNSQSIYFYIKTKGSLSSSAKIYIEKLNLLEDNYISNYIIRITNFRYFTNEEYGKYCIDNKVLPRREKVLAKDVD